MRSKTLKGGKKNHYSNTESIATRRLKQSEHNYARSQFIMTESLQASFERCCRLCAEEQDVTIMIFSQEAEAMLLQNKLNKYLLIEVDEDDKLPKNICLQCCSKLQIVCEFIDTARKAQDLLQDRSLILDDIEPKCFIESIKGEYKSGPQFC